MVDRCNVDHRGMFVVLLGPDGAGKSTVAEGIKQVARDEFQGFYHFHWRPGLLPKLSRSNRNSSSEVTGARAADAPPTESAYGTWVSLLRYLYYLADFFLGYWLRIRPRVRRGELVLGERWYYDVIAYPARYGYKLPGWVLRTGARILPLPDLTILLSADPDAIHERKPELSPSMIGAQLEKLRALLPKAPHGVKVSSACSPEQTVRCVRDEIVSRRKVRLEGSELNWRGFPGFGVVKVWVGPEDTLRNALRLYHPCSKAGKALVGLAKLLPEAIGRRLFCRSILTCGEAQQLERIAYLVSKVDVGRNAVVSISAGTPGVHQKYTAQLSVKGVPFAYAKIGQTCEITALVKNERDTLVLLSDEGFMSGNIPAAIGYWESAEDCACVLIQEGPGEDVKPVGEQIDERLDLFLLGLARRNKAKLGAVSLAEIMGVNSLINASREHLPEASCLLQQALSVLGVEDEKDYVSTCSHGDFAPWNVLCANKGERLLVIDWEYFAPQAPALIDLMHFIFMPLRLVKGMSPLRAVNSLNTLSEQKTAVGIIDACGIEKDDWQRYMLWYFLWLGVRESKNGRVSGYVLKCIRITMNQMSVEGVRPKVLVAAYACEPGEGSEPGVGWNWVGQISSVADAHVVTRGNNRRSIESAVSRGEISGVRFIYVDVPKWLSFWKRGQRGVRTYYYLWQFFALRKVKAIVKEEHFDFSHHVTFVNDWLWSFVALLPLPYIWGPVGSHPPCPLRLIARKKSKAQEVVRLVIQNTFRILDPLYWRTMFGARRVVAITRESFLKMPLRFVPYGRRRIEPAIAVEKLDDKSGNEAQGGRKILYVGRLHYTKCPQLAVESFAICRKKFPDATLLMIGEGPEFQSLKKLLGSQNLQHAATIRPNMPRHEVLSAMSEADLFLFPSTEGGGMVVLEAMASGLPVICLDYGGPGEMVHGIGGVCVRLGERRQVIQDLADAMVELFEDDDRRRKISAAAKRRVKDHYEWGRKEEFIRQEYRSLVNAEILHG